MTLTRLAASLAVAALSLTGCALVDHRADRREARAEAQFPPEGAFLKVNGRKVHYVQVGHGPDLVLLHGASGNTRDFTFDFVDKVKDRYRVTIFDRPGLGYTERVSPAFEGPFNTRAESPQQQAAFLHAAAGALGVENEIVLGHSYGGAVAMAWGLDYDPAALVIVSGATMPWPGGLGALNDVVSSSLGGAAIVPLLTAFAPDSKIDDVIASIFVPQRPPEGYADYVGAGLTLRRASLRANARQVATLRPHVVAMAKRYPDLDIPVEIMHGAADEIVPAEIHAEKLDELLPDSKLVELKGIGHMPHHVVPGIVAAAIDRAAMRAGLR